jgi:hypothetical protein
MKNFNDNFTAMKRRHDAPDNNEVGPTMRARTDYGDQHGDIYDREIEVAEAFAKAGYTLGPNGEDEDG